MLFKRDSIGLPDAAINQQIVAAEREIERLKEELGKMEQALEAENADLLQVPEGDDESRQEADARLKTLRNRQDRAAAEIEKLWVRMANLETLKATMKNVSGR